MARWFSALIRQRRPLVRALCSGSSGGISSRGIGSGGGIGGIGSGSGGIVLPVWPIGSEMRYSQMMYVGEAGTSIDSDKTEEVSSLCDLLLSKPNVFQALKDWIRDGNRFSSSFFTKVYYRLAKRRRYKEILQLLKGIREENILETTEMHYIWEMAITCRQHTTFGAEDFYHRIPINRKSDEVTAALIFSLAKQNALAKCESWIERTTVVSTDILNMLMQLYLSRDRHDKVLETYQRMRKTKMDPSIYTYLMLLTYKDKVGGGLDGIEAEAAEFVDGIDLETAVKRTLKEIMEINGFLARADRVDEIWNRFKNIKGAQEIDQTCYISAIASFGRAKDIENAERVYQELIKQDLSKHIPNPHSIMIEAYVVSGLMAEAEHILRNSLKDAVFCPYNSLVRGYIASGAADTALARLKEGVAAIPVKNIRPAYKTMMALLPVFAARRDVDGAERIMFHYRFAGDAAVYNELLKVYVACNVLPNDFRDRMQRNDVDGDEITEELLESVKSSPSAAMKEQRRRLHSANCRKTLAW